MSGIPTLGFAKVPIVDPKSGNPSWNFLQWIQKIETQATKSLTVLGINANAQIAGTNKTIGSATQNLTSNGQLPTASLTGTINGTQVEFTLDSVPDGTKRFASLNAGAYGVSNGTGLNGVAQVDTANLAIINFADTAHENKTLDNINDGTTYQRFSRIASGQAALPTGSIFAGAAGTSTINLPQVLATDTIVWNFSGSPASGYSANSGGSLSVLAYASNGSITFYIGNSTGSPITPSAQAVNYQVIR